MAELGLGAVRPLNKEKRTWIAKLKKEGAWDPILVTPIKDQWILFVNRWLAQSTGRNSTQKKNNERTTITGQCRFEHGQSQQNSTRHRPRVWL